jgi:hypothetical protein
MHEAYSPVGLDLPPLPALLARSQR